MCSIRTFVYQSHVFLGCQSGACDIFKTLISRFESKITAFFRYFDLNVKAWFRLVIKMWFITRAFLSFPLWALETSKCRENMWSLFGPESTCTHVHTFRDEEQLRGVLSTRRRALRLVWNISCREHGWGRYVGTDEEAARQADWPDPSGENPLDLKCLSSWLPCSHVLYFISNLPPACFSGLLWPMNSPFALSPQLLALFLLKHFVLHCLPLLIFHSFSLLDLILPVNKLLEWGFAVLVYILPSFAFHAEISTFLHWSVHTCYFY